jgi:hypothetical protein
MIEDKDMLHDTWTPYREVMRYRRLFWASMLLNLILAAALVHCLR